MTFIRIFQCDGPRQRTGSTNDRQTTGLFGMRPVLLVAIGGCSSSGKTTIAELTSKVFPQAVFIHQDDFYKADHEIPLDPRYGIQDWDCPEAIDTAGFARELDYIKANGHTSRAFLYNKNVDDISKFQLDPSVLAKLARRYGEISDCQIAIVDGFMIYNDQELSSKFDLRLLIRSPYPILKKRRANRADYQTADSSVWVDPPYYFDEIVYKSYRDTHGYLFKNHDVEDELMSNEIVDFVNLDETSLQDALEWVCDQIVLLTKGK